MIPTKAEILEVIEQLRIANPTRNDEIVVHMFCVGDTAGKIAAALNEIGESYDVERVITLGYLHDIGKLVGSYEKHPIDGYRYLKQAGYDQEYCDISLIHHFICNDENCVFSTVPDPAEDREMIEFVRSHTFTPEENLIVLCDAMCLFSVVTLEKRIVDVLSRHGTNLKTSERIIKTIELKREIENKLGHSLYDLFPEVKENL